jgi:hypothetical protein
MGEQGEKTMTFTQETSFAEVAQTLARFNDSRIVSVEYVSLSNTYSVVVATTSLAFNATTRGNAPTLSRAIQKAFDELRAVAGARS